MTVLETERLLIVNWQADDWQAFRYIATNPQVTRYIGNGQIWDDERIQKWVMRQIDNYTEHGFALWKLVEKKSGRLIGFCGLQFLANTGEIEIGWWLAEDCWGNFSEAASPVQVQATVDIHHSLAMVATVQVQGITANSLYMLHPLKVVAVEWGWLGVLPWV